MDVNDAFVIDVLIVWGDRAPLRRQLLYCCLKFTKAIATINKRDLRSNEDKQNRQKDFAFHLGAPTSLSAVGEHPCSHFFEIRTGRDADAFLLFEIHFGHRFGDRSAVLDDLHVLRMDRVCVQH